ncbi:MAG: bifunctional demethylmenaquinone methyltransferase/2-methoxy-6-polyprenyl-1,4-benzoquinol methylase UbiE [candidate division Zixibacteria bacterium]
MAESHGQKIRTMFDRISPRYDLLNRLLSGFNDMRWRRKAVGLLGDLSGKNALDLCCGTGDFLKILEDKYHENINLIGIDFAGGMLRIAGHRLNLSGSGNLVLCQGDALKLPCSDKSVHAVTIGFGIRNIIEKKEALEDIIRALAPGGRLVIIEPAIPGNKIIAGLFKFYFRKIMPIIGGILSGDYKAYKYLDKSVESFPEPKEFCILMEECGFVNVHAYRQTPGTAMIYYGEK